MKKDVLGSLSYVSNISCSCFFFHTHTHTHAGTHAHTRLWNQSTRKARDWKDVPKEIKYSLPLGTSLQQWFRIKHLKKIRHDFKKPRNIVYEAPNKHIMLSANTEVSYTVLLSTGLMQVDLFRLSLQYSQPRTQMTSKSFDDSQHDCTLIY